VKKANDRVRTLTTYILLKCQPQSEIQFVRIVDKLPTGGPCGTSAQVDAARIAPPFTAVAIRKPGRAARRNVDNMLSR
jgi:hypothetical protein